MLVSAKAQVPEEIDKYVGSDIKRNEPVRKILYCDQVRTEVTVASFVLKSVLTDVDSGNGACEDLSRAALFELKCTFKIYIILGCTLSHHSFIFL